MPSGRCLGKARLQPLCGRPLTNGASEFETPGPGFRRSRWKKSLSPSNRSLKAERVWAWRLSIRSCRRMEPRSPSNPNPARAQSFSWRYCAPLKRKALSLPKQPLRGRGMASILVCDDQRSICEMLDISLRRDGHRVETVNAGEAAKKKLSSANFEVLITDIKMPQTDGIEVLRFARQSSPETSVILITAVEDYEAAVQ